MGLVNDVTEETLADLADMRAADESVLSLYLDLDPARFATAPARATEIDALLSRARREVESRERPHAELLALRASLQHARELFSPTSPLADGARALALFACESLDLARVLRLPHPVASAAVVSDTPFIAPLAGQGPPGRVCVALVDERSARILRGSAENLREAVSFGDDVHGRHDQGGWSQARYQRSIFEDSEAHLRHVARVLSDLLRVAPYDRLLIACTEPLWPRVLARLRPEVRACLEEERLSLDINRVTIADVEAASAPVLAAEQRAHEQALLATLLARDAREQDGRAVSGLQAVLQALVEQRVAALLYEEGLLAPGVMCPRCGWMDTEGERCPADGEPLQRRDDVVEDAVEAAVRQSAEVLVLRGRPELGPLGRIAATLRF